MMNPEQVEKNRQRARLYYYANRETVKAKVKNYRKKNKRKIAERRAKKFEKLVANPAEYDAYKEYHRNVYHEKKDVISRQRKEDYRHNPVRWLLKGAKSRSKKRGLEFDITEDDIVVPNVCPALGIPFEVGSNCGNSMTLDRIDNTKGYVKGNVQILSKRANCIKSNATADEILAVGNYLKKLQNG